MQKMFLFFRMRRYGDIKEVMVQDVTLLESGLSGSDYWSPSFRGTRNGKVEPLREMPFSYATSAL